MIRGVAIAFLALLSSSHQPRTVTCGILESLPSLSDEILDPKFQVAVHKAPLGSGDEARFTDLQQIPMRDAQGTDHVCYLPAQTSAEDQVEDEAGEAPKDMTPPSELLKPLADLCFVKTLDWWTYEVCHQKKIRQFHIQGDKVDQEYLLGVHAANKSDLDVIKRESGPTGVSKAYVHEVFEGGSECEVVNALPNIERSVELRYTCLAGGEKADILSVRELHSCRYQVVVGTPLLCQHPAFQDAQVPVHDINCFPTGEVEGRGMSRSDVRNPETHSASTRAAASSDTPARERETEPGGEVQYDLESLSDEALDELVSKIIQGTQGDPDVDLLGLSDEDYAVSDNDEDSPDSGAQAGGRETHDHEEL